MKMGGYAGSILYVNLTTGKISKEPLAEEIARKFIGGMGINSKLAYDLIKPGTDPLGAENVLIFGAGPLVGTFYPGSAKCEATGKSPLTNMLGMANAGDSISAMLKYSGYDHLVITGRARKPVYIKVFDDEIEICDAGHLWGKDTWETADALWDELGECWVSCIGQAGENLVRFASIISNKYSVHGRTGLGAVMGSKNLKAIVARGTKPIEIADRKTFRVLANELSERITKSAATEMWRKLGFVVALDGYSKTGLFLQKNFSEGYGNLAKVFSQKEYEERVFKTYWACPSCPIGCKQVVEMKDGKYQGLTLQIGSLGAQVSYHITAGVENWDEVVKCVELENRYGMDSISLCGTAGLAMELFGHGIISREDTGGLVLKWGAETLKQLMEKIVRREGIGDVLAEGAQRASAKFGKGSEKYVMHIKGLEPALGLRGRLCTENFGQLTNIRGSHLDRSTSLTFIPRKPETIRSYCATIGMPEAAIKRVFEDVGPEGFNVARLTKWVEDYNSTFLSLGLCHRTPVTQHFSLPALAQLYTSVTGIEMTAAELRDAGERIWNLQKAFNVREGAGRKDDIPPWRELNEPLVINDKSYGPLSKKTVTELLGQYYAEREWDIESGIPTRQKLAALDLESIADDLGGVKTS